MTHVPVLVGPAIEYLALRPGGTYVDATFGGGGHARAILQQLVGGRLLAIDSDPDAVARASGIDDPRLTFVQANFRDIVHVLDRFAIDSIDGVLFDLGVSSMQLDDLDRGFSLGKAAALDMRMDPSVGQSAYEILTTASERELADIFFYYGQERCSRRIARAVVVRRANGTLPNTTAEFAQLVAAIVTRRGQRQRIHPATRVFQALRIAVNDELAALREGLAGAIGRLRVAGRVVAISFHSLEDRIVKETFRDDERLDVLTKRPVRPNDGEIAENRRARSAKLRAAQRKAG
ncbi:MAG: 16S rRNA (cytosine(1402)-N(4))-methyltransferase RsmH [Candidatus Eremiobacteraeota bacterium]|nr:16S rRNA (cytosine(1402)-N(4))-methyltransferase RsmH [Candidatus Eremiobacteraeota bacterium]